MKAVIYARYSSDNQREASIEGQLRECMEYAAQNDITVIANYIDRALTATSDNRPDFQRMIKDSYKHCFDMIIVWKLDRFSRDRYDSANYKHILKKNGVKVVSAKENISEGPEGIILESMLEGFEQANGHNNEQRRHIHKSRKNTEQQRHLHHQLTTFETKTGHRIRRENNKDCRKYTAENCYIKSIAQPYGIVT